MRRWTAAAFLAGLVIAPQAARTADGPATELERMSWAEPCGEIRAHLSQALEANAAIGPDARADIRAALERADPDAERATCLAAAKEAYDRLVAAYERTPASANVLGGATDAPGTPTAIEPETFEGKRAGEPIGDY